MGKIHLARESLRLVAEELYELLRCENFQVFANSLSELVRKISATPLLFSLPHEVPLDLVRPDLAACDFSASRSVPTGRKGVSEAIIVTAFVDDHRVVVDAIRAPERGGVRSGEPKVVIACRVGVERPEVANVASGGVWPLVGLGWGLKVWAG